jgi:predicted nuclease of predicted toxin-antitoxin system
MKFLIDNALSPYISKSLQEQGHDSVHVLNIGLASASDEIIFAFAEKEERILVSADTDFGTILALKESKKPSLILFRRSNKRPQNQAQILIANLPSIADALDEGSIVVFDDTKIRIRTLPISRGKE